MSRGREFPGQKVVKMKDGKIAKKGVVSARPSATALPVASRFFDDTLCMLTILLQPRMFVSFPALTSAFGHRRVR